MCVDIELWLLKFVSDMGSKDQNNIILFDPESFIPFAVFKAPHVQKYVLGVVIAGLKPAQAHLNSPIKSFLGVCHADRCAIYKRANVRKNIDKKQAIVVV